MTSKWEWRHNDSWLAGCERPRRDDENDVTLTIAGLWGYGDWRRVATGCTALVTADYAVNSRAELNRVDCKTWRVIWPQVYETRVNSVHDLTRSSWLKSDSRLATSERCPWTRSVSPDCTINSRRDGDRVGRDRSATRLWTEPQQPLNADVKCSNCAHCTIIATFISLKRKATTSYSSWKLT